MMEQPMLGRIKQWTVGPNRYRLAFFGGFIGLAALVYGTQVLMHYVQQLQEPVLGEISTSGPSGQPLQPGLLSGAQSAQLNALLEMNQLITTLGTALIGALGFLLGYRKTEFTPSELWPAFASFACVAASILFGYESYWHIIDMLQSAQNIGWFDVTSGVIPVDREFHFFFFVLGVVFFADFAFHVLNKKESAANASSS
jgi:hypothetical protein